MTLKLGILVSICIAVALGTNHRNPVSAALPDAGGTLSSLPDKRVNLKELGLSFIPNMGQFPEDVLFASQAAEYDLFFLKDRIVFNLIAREPVPQRPANDASELRLRKGEMSATRPRAKLSNFHSRVAEERLRSAARGSNRDVSTF